MNELVNTEWYNQLVEDCNSIITEAVYISRWALVEGYHNLGTRILEEQNFERSKIYGEKIVQVFFEYVKPNNMVCNTIC